MCNNGIALRKEQANKRSVGRLSILLFKSLKFVVLLIVSAAKGNI
jgi:hypothetical protein